MKGHGALRCGQLPGTNGGAPGGLPWIKPNLAGGGVAYGPCILVLWSTFRLVEATLIITVAPLSFSYNPKRKHSKPATATDRHQNH